MMRINRGILEYIVNRSISDITYFTYSTFACSKCLCRSCYACRLPFRNGYRESIRIFERLLKNEAL